MPQSRILFPFKDDVRELLNIIVDHGLEEANHFSKKIGA